jgi:hypothetical protein
MHENSTRKLMKNYYKGGEEGEDLRKRNVDGVNLIKAHYMQVVNIIMKPICTVNLC